MYLLFFFPVFVAYYRSHAIEVRLFVQVGNQARAPLPPQHPPTPPSYDLFFFTSLRTTYECFVVRPVLTLIHWGIM